MNILKKSLKQRVILLILFGTCLILAYFYFDHKQRMKRIPPFYPILPIAERRRRVGGGLDESKANSKDPDEIAPKGALPSGFLEHKTVICHSNHRLGNQHDGGWNVCYSSPFNIMKPCLVYSFGIGDDWRFEDDMYDLHQCQVMAYDPSIGKEEHNRTDGILFKPIGLGATNSRKARRKKWKMKTFDQILVDEGHAQVLIDYLKFDIEYMEWEIIPELVKGRNSLKLVKQLGFEMHLRDPLNKSAMKTPIEREEFLEKYKILKLIEKAGFKKYDYRLNPFCTYLSPLTGQSRSWCYELFYINIKLTNETHLRVGGSDALELVDIP